MRGKDPTDLICLHTEEDGDYWYIDQSGRYTVFDRLDTGDQLRSATYRVLGVPENYRLITELYARLNHQEVNARVCVGAQKLCRKRKSSTREILNCISVLKVHDSLRHQWHDVNSRSFNNYLLLRSYQEEGFSDLVTTVFKHHCLFKHFEFAGIPVHYSIQLLSMIVDPRWFLSVQRSSRMQPFEAYFGLSKDYFEKVHEPKLVQTLTEKAIRTVFLSNAVTAADSNSFLHDARDQRRKCKVLLGYIVRNWLESLGLEGYFVPNKFFGPGFGHWTKEYQHRFRNT